MNDGFEFMMDVSNVDIDSDDLTQIYVYDDFEDALLESVIPKLDRALRELPKLRTPKITIHISSMGGDTRVLFEILARVEALKAAGVIVETRVMSGAYSCGSLLAIAGTKGYRFMGPYADQLLHFGSVGSGRISNPTELERTSNMVQVHFDTIVKIINKYAKVPALKSKLQDDNLFISATEAVAWGMADFVTP